MNENILLDNVITVLDDKGYESAYQYLIEKKEELPKEGAYPLVYYFLSCLAAGCGKKDEAISWLQEAIYDKGYWFTTEIINDEDLSTIFDQPEYIKLKKISEERMKKTIDESVSICTWEKKEADSLFLVLHGNGENGIISKNVWSQMNIPALQIESIQSSHVHSYERFRWTFDDDNYQEPLQWIQKMPWGDYRQKYLGGFSAGCDMILRLLAFSEIDCDAVILQAPYIPIVNSHLDVLTEALKNKNVAIKIFVGEHDENCLEMCQRLYNHLNEAGIKIELTIQKGLKHTFPEVLNDSYKNIFK